MKDSIFVDTVAWLALVNKSEDLRVSMCWNLPDDTRRDAWQRG
jgi:hypothetical protein